MSCWLAYRNPTDAERMTELLTIVAERLSGKPRSQLVPWIRDSLRDFYAMAERRASDGA